jgi:indole-3-glycerol phosphate synthase
MSVLSEILAAKRTEVDCAKRRIPISELQRQIADLPETRDFAGALTNTTGTALIAEVKRASPSKGVIRENFEPVEIARELAEGGAACLSVLTEESFFQGHLSFLPAIRHAVDLPLLRKDFLIDDYQLLESRAAGADAVLMIVAALSHTNMDDMLSATHELGMAAIVEVHDKDELEEAITSGARIIGINNRDLHTFRTTLQTTLDLLPRVPKNCLTVSESGINVRADVERLASAGIDAVLVGEAIMREQDVRAKVEELLGR